MFRSTIPGVKAIKALLCLPWQTYLENPARQDFGTRPGAGPGYFSTIKFGKLPCPSEPNSCAERVPNLVQMLIRILSTFSHHPARLTLGDCGRRGPVLLSFHARDLVPAVRERERISFVSTMVVVHVFRGRFLVVSSKYVTNGRRAVSARPGNFLPGPGARKSGRARFCRRAI